jgi:hypothetical protein
LKRRKGDELNRPRPWVCRTEGAQQWHNSSSLHSGFRMRCRLTRTCPTLTFSPPLPAYVFLITAVGFKKDSPPKTRFLSQIGVTNSDNRQITTKPLREAEVLQSLGIFSHKDRAPFIFLNIPRGQQGEQTPIKYKRPFPGPETASITISN